MVIEMEFKKVDKNNYVIRIDRDEEVIDKITEFCREEKIKVGYITGLGAAKKVTIGLFDTTKKEYISHEYMGPMEITSLVGNVSTKDGEVYLHLHINLCDKEMRVIGGHLNSCVIGATGELYLTFFDNEVEREFSEEIGLNLYKF